MDYFTIYNSQGFVKGPYIYNHFILLIVIVILEILALQLVVSCFFFYCIDLHIHMLHTIGRLI